MATPLNTWRQEKIDNELQQAALKHEGRVLLNIAERSPKQKARLDAIDAELTTLSGALVDITKNLAIEERRSEDARTGAGVPSAHLWSGSHGDRSTVTRATGRRFAQMFPHASLDMGGFRSAEEFLAILASGLPDPRLLPDGLHAASGSIKVPSDGGFAVPTQVLAGWLDASLENEIVRRFADIRPMTSNEAVAPGWDDTDHSDNLYGGIAGEWVGEGGTMTVQAPKTRNVKLKANKLALLMKTSDELVADGISYEEQLGQAIVRALGWFLDRAFLTGTGAGQPLGILNAPCTVTVSKTAGQTANTITYANLCNMFARLHPASLGNAVWVANSTAIPQLLQLTITIGTGGSLIPVMTGSNGQFRILTRPVVFTEKVPALGTKGDIMLLDLSQYIVGLRADFTLAKSGHVYFATGETAYRGIIRVDGQPKLNTVVTPDAGDTLSPFVVIETRS